MDTSETPHLTQIGWAVAFGAAIFWPAWLAAVVLGILSVRRQQRRFGTALLLFAAVPVCVLVLFVVLGALRVDVGLADNVAARALDAAALSYYAFTGLCVVGVIAVLLRWAVAWFRSGRGRQHA